MTKQISITDIEAAINYWRLTHPAQGEELRLNRQAAALAEPYAMLIMTKRGGLSLDDLDSDARLAFETWQAAVADSDRT
jgi:hypothetical protein